MFNFLEAVEISGFFLEDWYISSASLMPLEIDVHANNP